MDAVFDESLGRDSNCRVSIVPIAVSFGGDRHLNADKSKLLTKQSNVN